ncbi:MAG: hypothetical protein RXO43_02370 [Candidatus Micrarchaeota archaeon]
MEYLEVDDPKIIEEVDKLGKNNSVVELDLDKVIANRIEIRQYNYGEAIQSLVGVEAKEEKIKEPIEKEVTAPQEGIAVEKAASEIKNVIGSIGKEFEKNIKRETERIKGEKLVLPTLSLQDQISELEKISEGLDEQVFSDEQLKIIKDEVYGLRDKVKSEKISIADEFQKSLIDLRNQKINEVIKKLK